VNLPGTSAAGALGAMPARAPAAGDTAAGAVAGAVPVRVVPASALHAARLALLRDLQLAFRRRAQLVQPLAFFALVTMLFPLAVSPELARLREIAPGVLWVAALLASLLALDFLFRDDAYDGTLEQYALSGQSLTALMFAKTAAHWLLTGLPLALMAPLAALSLGASASAIPGIVVSVTVGSIALSLIGSIGAALTLAAVDAGVDFRCARNAAGHRRRAVPRATRAARGTGRARRDAGAARLGRRGADQPGIKGGDGAS
jgi:heme exporter protein B